MRRPVKASKSKIKVLVIFANPRNTDPLRLSTEDRAIHEAIQLSPHRDRISITTRHAATIHDLRRSLLAGEFQLVHISGHGDEEGLILEDEIGKPHFIPQAALADLLRAYSPPLECVILNACYSISQGKLMSLGVPFTIAMEGSISDQAAIEFSRGFYDAVGAGKPIDFAYEEGCRNVKLIVPNAPFISQILINDNAPKHFLIKEKEAQPRGYISINSHNGYIAIRPTSYQTLRELADDLYLNYLTDRYKPYSYGSSWALSAISPIPASPLFGGTMQQILAPWTWLLPENRNKAIIEFDRNWMNSPINEYKLIDRLWQIINLPIPVVGWATNHDLRTFFHDEAVIEKALRKGMIK